MEQSDEGALLALLATDVDGYYPRLMAAYAHRLYNFILNKTRDQHDAEDILQDALLRALYYLRGYSAQRICALKLRPWLYKITYNVYLNYVERYKPPPSVWLDTSEDGPYLELEDEQSEQPDMVVEMAEHRRELESLVDMLPQSSREAIRLHYFEDFSYDEIADVLNQKNGTVRVNVHRGLRMLRQTLEKKRSEGYNGA